MTEQLVGLLAQARHEAIKQEPERERRINEAFITIYEELYIVGLDIDLSA
jgi:hypothetical protein